MDALLHAPPRSRVIGALFNEDFDLPPEAAPDPEVIEAVFSAGEMAGARELAWLAGHAAGVQEVATSSEAATRQALECIAAQFNAASAAAAAQAEKSAEAIAGLLLGSLAATFPALCACYGDAEVRAIVRAVLPALTQEPAINIRANPRTAAAVAKEIDRLNPELAAHVQTTASDAMPPGDVRIAWRNGAIARDATALWREVAAVLTPAALLPAENAIAALLRTENATQETVDG